jgi:hypothetical protein
LFIDFKKAYDSIHRESLWNILREFGIPGKLIGLIKMCIEDSRGIVISDGLRSEPFEITTGLRQGDALSPLLFNLALEKCIREATGGERDGATILGYADDIDLLSEDSEKVRSTFRGLKSAAGKIGLQINQEKTEYLEISRNNTSQNTGFIVDEMNFRNVSSVKYLGTNINSKNKTNEEIKARIHAGNRSYYALQSLISSKILSHRIKIEIYKTCIRPIVLYGAEAWNTTIRDENILQSFENKILRKIFGPTWDNSICQWRRRHNREIHENFKTTLIVNEMRATRLRWLGHVERMEETRSVKKAYRYTPTGKRPRGRPRQRWMDNVQRDLEQLGVLEWREKARDRREWRKTVLAAKSLGGSSS